MIAEFLDRGVQVGINAKKYSSKCQRSKANKVVILPSLKALCHIEFTSHCQICKLLYLTLVLMEKI